MNIHGFLEMFSRYGIFLLFLIVFLEYLNLPGLPAGIIMPAAGILVSQSKFNIMWVIVLSVIAGLLGSVVLYTIGYFGSYAVLDKLKGKNQKFDNIIEKTQKIIDEKGGYGVFLCRLMPVIRTIVSIPAGVFRMPFFRFCVYSAPGIFLWNLAFVLAGYFFGNVFL